MKISIITVCLNTDHSIGDTIRSIQCQSYEDIEHIIVDGGSSDRTLEVIKSLIDKKAHLISEPDKGIYDAMNKGIRLATGELVGFLNSGDVFNSSDILEDIVREIMKSNADTCWGDLCYVAEDDSSKVIRYWKSGEYKTKNFSKGWVPPHPTFYAKKKVYENFGVFDLSYSLAADFEIMCRFLEKYKVRSVYLPEVLVRMRLGGITNSSLGNIFVQNMEILRALRENGLGVSGLFLFNKLKNKIMQFKPVRRASI